MLITFILLFLSRGVSPSIAADAADDKVAWYSAPNFRGTWDLIISCLLTLTICVWSALHLNVPAEDSRLRDRNTKRAKWILMGIFAPELVVSTAFAQYLTARWLKQEIAKDIKHRTSHSKSAQHPIESNKWSITQCYFAVMGGVVIETGDCVAGNPRLSLTAEGIRLLSFLDRLPHIREHQIRDKSKADGLAKLLVLLQAGWMVLQTIARLDQGLPVTLLEINTIRHVLCAFSLYLLWWSKPLEIKDAHFIRREEWMDSFVALMYMCSPISGDSVDKISEMRCMSYTPPDKRNAMSVHKSPIESLARVARKPDRTRFSVGSVGAKDPPKFIGPLEKITIGAEEHSKSTPFDHNVSYIIQKAQVATEHEVFFHMQESCHGLRHTRKYCRRAFSDCRSHDPLGEKAIERWRLANTLVDQLWEECERRPSYVNSFFTTSTLGTFVGEPVYVAHHIPNFPGLSFLGSVNVNRDRLKIVVAFAGAAYGGLHLVAWKHFFPTSVERYMWISCACATGLTGLVLALLFLATNQIQSIEVAESRIRNSKKLRAIGKWVLAPLFMTARIFIVVEAFVCLRKQPAAVYKTPEWSNYFPHL